jgi:5-methylcytosine-specific restriction endonuclease McrA
MTAPGQTRAGGEKRGNTTDRARRKVWMLFEFGNGEYALCTHCRLILTYDTIEADRIIPGGSYAHDNIQPSCRGCNLDRSNKSDWTSPQLAAELAAEAEAFTAAEARITWAAGNVFSTR